MGQPQHVPAGAHRPDARAFRQVVGRFATGVTVVTTRHDGVDHAMTASSFASVSLDPLLVLVCVQRDVRFHDAVMSSGTWGVNVLGSDMADVSAWFATRGRPLAGQLDIVAHAPGPATGTALFTDALATLECRTTEAYPGGDHTVVLGEVLAVDLRRPRQPPLVYWRGNYYDISSIEAGTDPAARPRVAGGAEPSRHDAPRERPARARRFRHLR